MIKNVLTFAGQYPDKEPSWNLTTKESKSYALLISLENLLARLHRKLNVIEKKGKMSA